MALVLNHQTKAQFAARLRALYLGSSREETIKLATKLLDWIDAGDLTDLQARTAFSHTLGQWTALKAKMTTMRMNYTAVQGAAGE